jgi:hypothetical protein
MNDLRNIQTLLPYLIVKVAPTEKRKAVIEKANEDSLLSDTHATCNTH